MGQFVWSKHQDIRAPKSPNIPRILDEIIPVVSRGMARAQTCPMILNLATTIGIYIYICIYVSIYLSIYLSIQDSNSNQIMGPCGLLGSKRAAKFCEPLKRSAVSAFFVAFKALLKPSPANCAFGIVHRLLHTFNTFWRLLRAILAGPRLST